MILGLIGDCGSGKSTIAKAFSEKYGWQHLSFADTLKEEVSKHFSPDNKLAPLKIPKEELGWNGQDWSGPKSEIGRRALQAWGARKRSENKSHWIDIVKKKITNKNVIISDVRYLNEIRWIKAQHGTVGRVCRDTSVYEKIMEGQFDGELSELEWRVWGLYAPYKEVIVINNYRPIDLVVTTLHENLKNLGYFV